MKKTVLKILFFAVVFVFGFSVWYSPVVFKGSAPYKIKEQITLAKSLSETGVYSFENSQNVFLPTSLIKESGESSSIGNKLTASLYGRIFKITGVLSPANLVLFSIFLNCLTLLIFAFIVYKLFGFKISALFSGIYVLMPYNWLQVYSIGSYEFAIFFLSLFFLFFILERESKYKNVFLYLAGTFLALSAMAKEAFLLLIPILFVYLWSLTSLAVGGSVTQKLKKMAPIFVSIILVLSVFYIPSFFGEGSGNVNLKLFFSNSEKTRSFEDFTMNGHLYPDPYTYQHERESFLESYNQKIEKVGLVESLRMKKVLVNVGERPTKIWERFLLGDFLLLGHLGYFVSLEESGGPFVLFFGLLGLFFYLKKKNYDLYKFFIFWFLGTLFLMSYIVQVSRTHMMDFSWAIPLLAALGIFYMVSLFEKKNILLTGFLAFTLLYSIFLADHVVFGKVYDGMPAIVEIENLSKKIKNIGDKEVVAVGIPTQDALLLNYLSNKSVLVFRSATLEKLIGEDKLGDVFEEYKIKYVFGYNEELSDKVAESTGVEVLEVEEVKEEQISYLKSFLLALFR